MEPTLLLYALLLWILFFPFAIVNAGLREKVWAPRFGEHAGHVISTIIFLVVLLLAIYAFLRVVDIPYNPGDLWLLGVLWLVLTVLFEFGFGHYVMGNSWEALLHDYNLLAGRVWVFIPLAWLLSPRLIGWLVRA
ncbi:MAG: hypothetical protein PHU95_02330 [Candidatus Thermoplasmatota archaeon]|nr:hypothetical protein [Candidatus Thermoplasmatota archaeon]MDD5778269.1 hypothetical protein [Candidatus Thermoplasmatota archaeon]